MKRETIRPWPDEHEVVKLMPWTNVDAKVPLIAEHIEHRDGPETFHVVRTYGQVVDLLCAACDEWIRANTSGHYFIADRSPQIIKVRFEDEDDALVFKMRFG